jgi:hypothetical protein
MNDADDMTGAVTEAVRAAVLGGCTHQQVADAVAVGLGASPAARSSYDWTPMQPTPDDPQRWIRVLDAGEVLRVRQDRSHPGTWWWSAWSPDGVQLGRAMATSAAEAMEAADAHALAGMCQVCGRMGFHASDCPEAVARGNG